MTQPPLAVASPVLAALESGLDRASDALRPLQRWLVAALSSREGLEAHLGDEPLRRMRALLLVPPLDHAATAARLCAARPVSLVLEALVAPSSLALIAQRKPPVDRWVAQAKVKAGSELDRQWLEEDREAVAAYTQLGGEGIARAIDLCAWALALRPHLDAATDAEREACHAMAGRARATLPIAQRAALARAFRETHWAEDDAANLIAQPSVKVAGEVVTWLLPYIERDETFAALAALASGPALFGSATYAELVAFAPAPQAARRLATLLQAPLAAEATSHIIVIVEALARFRDEVAAEAIASAALFARDHAKAYFAKHPDLVSWLVAQGKGRGKRPEQVRDLLVEMDRQKALQRGGAAPSAAELPACIASPPWEQRSEPWPARDLDLIVDREQVVDVPELVRLRERLAAGSADRSPERDRELLAGKGMLDAVKYAQLTDDAAIENVHRLAAFALANALARFGERAIAKVAGVMSGKPMKMHADVLGMVRTPRLALVACSFHHDEAWLLADPELSALGLVPSLFAVQLARRHEAELGLLRLCAEGHRDVVDRASLRYGADVAAQVARILDRDPAQRLPPTLPKLHAKLEDGSLPVLATAHGPLPPASNRTVGMLLAISQLWLPHPGLAELRSACTLASREELAWEIFTKTGNLDAIAYLGGDSCVRRLDQLLSAAQTKLKPAQIHRAYEVLASVGTPLSHVLLLKHSLLSAWSDRNERIASLLPLEALENGTFPRSVGDGSLDLDYGARAFRVQLDDHLVPWICEPAGGRVAKLPRPTKRDDPAKAAHAAERFAALSLDLDDVRQTILVWFERALATGRTWPVARFRSAIATHPLLVQIARRLVWRTREGTAFRVSEDGSFADHDDAALELREDAEVSLQHPLDLDAARLQRFRQLLHDYAIIQPFEQLGRATFRLDDEERQAAELRRFEGRVVATARRNALLGGPGWQHGPGIAMHKPLRGCVVQLEIARSSVHARGATAADRLGVVRLTNGAPFSSLGEVEASELLRDLETLPGP